jgi:hypothetical protein
MNVFSQYQQEHYKKYPKKDPLEYEQKLQKMKDKQTHQKNPPKPVDKLAEQELPSESHSAKSERIKEQKEIIENKMKNENERENQIKKAQLIKQNQPENEEKKKTSAIDISTYNGGMTEKYLWSQSVNDVTVQIKIPKGTKPKEVIQKFDSK